MEPTLREKNFSSLMQSLVKSSWGNLFSTIQSELGPTQWVFALVFLCCVVITCGFKKCNFRFLRCIFFFPLIIFKKSIQNLKLLTNFKKWKKPLLFSSYSKILIGIFSLHEKFRLRMWNKKCNSIQLFLFCIYAFVLFLRNLF